MLATFHFENILNDSDTYEFIKVDHYKRNAMSCFHLIFIIVIVVIIIAITLLLLYLCESATSCKK